MADGAHQSNRWITLLAWVVGLVFMAAAFLKAWEISQFSIQISHYRLLPSSLELPAAFGLVLLECLIGICLLTGYQRNGALGAGAVLLVVFVAATGFRWKELQGTDCGCFGSFDRGGPAAVLWQDTILLALMALVYKFRRRVPELTAQKIITVAVTLLCVATATYSEMDSSAKVAALDSTQVADGPLNIVIYLSSTCPHCIANAEKINRIVATPNLPPIQTYLGGDTPDQFASFLRDSHLNVPYKEIQFGLLWLMTKTVPVIELRRGTTIVARWDGNMPAPEEVVQAVEAQKHTPAGKPTPSS